ncbi:hypothetical protein [Mitsuaria sp. PDC51]|uniref:hypothetical protein n=1 Tax=Mitsuaria sp. PDC51 TaxID=1881035 RepID=UPI000B8880AF|nr:hypothetical protein [Mitsuaria sp. PDC51]
MPPLDLEAQRREESLPAEFSVCRVVLAAAVHSAEDFPLTQPEIAARYPMANCVAAHVFKVPPHVVLLEFDQQVSHRDAAMVASVEAVLRTFPRAEFIDLPGQNSLIELLVDASDEIAPAQKQLETMYRCTMPSDDLVAIAASSVDGLLAQRNFGARLVEADVFEVHTELGIAHLATPDGRMLCITERTPGIASLSLLEDGQRYRCWVHGRSNLVQRAEPAD